MKQYTIREYMGFTRNGPLRAGMISLPEHTVDITLSLVEDEWKINATDDVIDAMVGGMMTSLSSLGDSLILRISETILWRLNLQQ